MCRGELTGKKLQGPQLMESRQELTHGALGQLLGCPSWPPRTGVYWGSVR